MYEFCNLFIFINKRIYRNMFYYYLYLKFKINIDAYEFKELGGWCMGKVIYDLIIYLFCKDFGMPGYYK